MTRGMRIGLGRALLWVAVAAVVFDLARIIIRQQEFDGFSKLLAVIAFHAFCARGIILSFPSTPPEPAKTPTEV